MSFSEDLKKERQRLGLSRAQTAAILRDVSESWIVKAEGSLREPHPWMQAEALRRLREQKRP